MTCVTEFVILSGPEVYEYLLQVRAQLHRHLAALFPSYAFSLATQEGEGMGFLVVPVVGTIGERSGDMAEPQQSVLLEIKMALEAFEPEVSALH